jgi:outer membrane protein TolC
MSVTLLAVAVGASWCLLLDGPAWAQTTAPPAGEPPPARPARQLSLDQAIQLALEQNLGIQIERVNPRIQDERVASARAAFLPTLGSDLSYNNSDSPPDSFLSGSEAGSVLKTDFFQTTADLRQQLPWGGASYALGWEGSRSTTNNIFSNFDPRLQSNVQFSFSQPLLRDFGTDAARTELLASRRGRDIADLDLRATIVQTVRDVKQAYWDLKYKIAHRDVQQQSLDLARQTLRDNRTRVEVGTMAPIDIVEAEAEVARNEEAVIIAEAAIQQAEDRLRTLIFDRAAPDFWRQAIEPIDAPRLDAVGIDVEAAVRSALDGRTDLQRAHVDLAGVNDTIRFFRNQTLPRVDARFDYRATGLGGTQLERGGGFPGPVIGEVTRGFGDVLADVLKSDFPTWTAGIVVSYPIGRSSAQADLARTRLAYSQSELQITNLELQIVREVRDLGRQVTTNAKRIEATGAARVLAERRLEAEQKKFGVGTSTSFLVFQAQRDLATARANELRAVLDYNTSLADFEAVQEAAPGGSAVTLGGTTTLSSQAPSAGATGQTR